MAIIVVLAEHGSGQLYSAVRKTRLCSGAKCVAAEAVGAHSIVEQARAGVLDRKRLRDTNV
jgi:hypothetical protein